MTAGEDMSMISRAPPSRFKASDCEDSPESPSVSPFSALQPPAEGSPLSPALSFWQDIISAIKLKFEGDMLPPSPSKCTCRVRDGLGFHQEEEDPIF